MRIVFPHPPGSGGPGSFQIRFEKELSKRGWSIGYPGNSAKPDVIFVVGGTKRILWLLLMKLKGVPIVYRLDGISWLHRRKKINIRKYLLAEFRNWSSKFIHAFLADKVIYQSSFVEAWWNKSGWKKVKDTCIIYNGVEFKENITDYNKPEQKRLVILEGIIDYSPYAVKLINDLALTLPESIRIELYGRFEKPSNEFNINRRIQYNGYLPREKVMNVLRGSVYLSLDIHPACPNTVIEAMASGAPVVAFNTGAIPELINNKCGAVVPYGSDPWDLGIPDFSTLQTEILNVFDNYRYFSINAYDRAVKLYNLQDIVSNYINHINRIIQQ